MFVPVPLPLPLLLPLACKGFTIISTIYASTIHKHVVIACLTHVVICSFQVKF